MKGIYIYGVLITIGAGTEDVGIELFGVTSIILSSSF
jgi:hypothetical protein